MGSTSSTYPAAWMFNEDGPIIDGTVVKLTMRTPPDGEPYPIVQLQLPSGEDRSVHLFHVAAAGSVAALRPKVGERLRIERKGQAESAAGRKYWVYDASCPDRPEAEFSWDQVTGDAPAHETDIPVHEPEPVATSATDDSIPF